MDAYLAKALEAVESAVGQAPPDVIARPVDGRWSIAQILEHLTLTYVNSANGLEKALTLGTLKIRTPVLSQRLARVLVVDLGYFPRVEAPETSRPTGRLPPEGSVAALRDALLRLDRTMAQIVERFGDQAPVLNHPYFAAMSIAQWRKFHWRHAVHHMKQVRARL